MSIQEDNQQPEVELICPECGGGYNDPTTRRNQQGVEKAFCPHCGEELSEKFVEDLNIEHCAHNATKDSQTSDGYVEVCTECGVKWDLHGQRIGVKSAWNPAGEDSY